jgi:hypothetical protein
MSKPADHGEYGPSGKYYVVASYAEQKAKGWAGPPRGICRACETNPVLRKDNCVRVHNSAPYTRCRGSEQPSLGLPYDVR